MPAANSWTSLTRAGRSAMLITLLRHDRSAMWTDRVRRGWRGLREKMPAPLAPPDTYAADDIAAMLRELGIAMVEVVQPTQLVRTRLHRVARRYTTKDVRLVVLPTVLWIQ